MASIIDSLRNIVGDSAPFVKICFIAVFLFISYDVWGVDTIPILAKFSIWAVSFLYFWGYILLTIHNTINTASVFMPNCFEFIQIFSGAFASLSALSPICIIGYFVFQYLSTSLTFEPIVNNIITSTVMLIIFSIFSIQFLLFAKKYKIKDAYNIKAIFEFSGDVFLQTLKILVFITLFTGIIGWSLGYITYTLFGYGQVFCYYITAYIVFTIMLIVQYYSQLYFEYIDLGD